MCWVNNMRRFTGPGIFIGGAVAGVLGLTVWGHLNPALTSVASARRPDFAAAAESFSEVTAARMALNYAAGQVLVELREHRLEALLAKPAAERSGHLYRSIEVFEFAREELKGTDREELVLHSLLELLAEDRQYDRWLNLYLELVYRQPVNGLVGRLAPNALRIARTSGREQEVLAAFGVVQAMPFDSEVKDRISASLNDVRSAGAASIEAPVVRSQSPDLAVTSAGNLL